MPRSSFRSPDNVFDAFQRGSKNFGYITSFAKLGLVSSVKNSFALVPCRVFEKLINTQWFKNTQKNSEKSLKSQKKFFIQKHVDVFPLNSSFYPQLKFSFWNFLIKKHITGALHPLVNN